MGCGIEKQKKQLHINDLDTCSRKNMDQIKMNDLSPRQLNYKENENNVKIDALVISSDSFCYEIIHSNDKAKLRIINYYIDLDGRLLAKQKQIKKDKLQMDFKFSLDSNDIIIRRNLQIGFEMKKQ